MVERSHTLQPCLIMRRSNIHVVVFPPTCHMLPCLDAKMG